MKQVDYRHFGRFLCPHTLTARGDDLYFCIKRADFVENCDRSDLCVLRDGRPKRLTSSGDVSEYHLLADGIVFVSQRKKKDKEASKKGIPLTVLQKLPYNGGEAEELLHLPYNVSGLWFLSTKEFFFTASCSREYEAALAASDGDAEKAAEYIKKEEKEYRVLDEVPFCSNGEGNINGIRDRLFFWKDGKITQITGRNTDAHPCLLSADKKKLWYTARNYEGCDPFYDRLFELDTGTLHSVDISVCDTAQYFGVWPLADGRIAVIAIVSEKYGVNENPKVYVRENNTYRLVYGSGEHNFYASLNSDVIARRAMALKPMVRGNRLFLLDTQDDSVYLTSLDVNSGQICNVTRERGNITDAVLYRKGFAMVALRGNGGGEVYSVTKDGAETRLTDLNTGICAEYAYSTPQAVSIRNQRGSEIHGWVIPPVDMVRGRKYPTILDIHGGPKTVYGPCYFHEMQLWAGRGFAVIFCNPTGSDGRGDDFADIRGDYGGQDYRDLMAFTDEAVHRFDFIDQNRMGVTGGSYGGFMTNWIIGHTDRFRAAASQRSIANWTGYYGTSDIGYFFQPDQTGADPWGDVKTVWEQSPLKYADRVKTPTLFIHSDEDYRCPLSEGLQMFTALRSHGVEARLCIFKGENHELSRSGKPKHRVRRLKEITEWFEKYLKSE